jgi:hypothetical protein
VNGKLSFPCQATEIGTILLLLPNTCMSPDLL